MSQMIQPKHKNAASASAEYLVFTTYKFSLYDSPLLGHCYTNPMSFVQRCNIALCFIQPFQCPHSPTSQKVAPNT